MTCECHLPDHTPRLVVLTGGPGAGKTASNQLRIERAREAQEIDGRIEKTWAKHPRRAFVQSETDFLRKVARAVALIREEVPACCRPHRVPEVDR